MQFLLKLLSAGLLFAWTTRADDSDSSCSPTSPCKVGCCSKSGFCGFGPDFCAPGNCVSTCDQKSECDAGWGAQWAKAEGCPLNVCCSRFGFCGTTPEFCGTEQVTAPSCSGQTAGNRVIGYYEGWSTTRACDGMFPENIPYESYTHLNYAFAFIDPHSFAVAPSSYLDMELYSRFTGLKAINPGLQTWISIGGWSMNDPDQPTASTFSDLVASPSAQSNFFNSLLTFLSTYGFDGVDIDWEYPVAPERSGRPEDMANYVSFLRNLRDALGSTGHHYGLTITIPSSYWYMQHFDIVSISQIVDWFNVMTYDLHGTWDSTDPWIGPFVNAHTNLTEIDQTMDLLWRNNIDPSKVTLGLGFYGRSFTLSDPGCTQPGCPFSGGGNPGECTASAGTLSYAEIGRITAAGANVVLDTEAAVKIATFDSNQWVSYDDQDTFKMKVDYANSHCLGGVMVWAVSNDDAYGSAANALSIATGRSSFSSARLANAPSGVAQCIWGQCGMDCPAGLSPAQRSDGSNRGNVGIYTGCPKGQTRNYCCPSNDVPTCQWRGTAPSCAHAQCLDGEVAVASDTSGTGKSCSFNHKNLCCQSTGSDSAVGACEWVGSAPICAAKALLGGPFFYSAASCPDNKPTTLTTGKEGFGGEQSCSRLGGYKSLCCSDPVPFTGCEWYQAGGSWLNWAFATTLVGFYPCKGECPDGKVPIAADDTGCWTGTSYFCCDNPNGNTVVTPAIDDMCAAPDSLFLESNEPDEDGLPTDFIEAYQFESDCFVSGEAGSGDPNSPLSQYQTRDLVTGAEDNSTYLSSHEIRGSSLEDVDDLFARGSKRLQNICLNPPGPDRRGRTNKFRAQPYPSVAQLREAGRMFVSSARTLACAAAPLLASSSREAGAKYVTEHVTELQSVKLFVQSLIDGTLPGNGQLAAGKFPFQGIFDAGGKFQQTWEALGVAAPLDLGTSPESTIYSVLGVTQDITNLLIVESKVNSLKALIWAGAKNIVGDTYGLMSHLERINVFNKIISVFDYLNLPESQTALQHGYDSMRDVWVAFQSAIKPTVAYDIVGAYKDWNLAQYANMVTITTTFLNSKLPGEIAYWASNDAATQYGRAVAQARLNDLLVMQATLLTKIAVNTEFID